MALTFRKSLPQLWRFQCGQRDHVPQLLVVKGSYSLSALQLLVTNLHVSSEACLIETDCPELRQIVLFMAWDHQAGLCCWFFKVLPSKHH